MASNFDYNEEESKKTERAYLAPEIVIQRKRTLETLSPTVEERIIDVGCGPGLLAHDLAIAVGRKGRVVGVDTSAPMLRLAERRCAELHQVELVESDASNLPTDDASVDAVTCVQVLLYIANIERVLAEIHRVLRVGGRIVIMETDWRSAVLNSSDPTLTDKMIAAWDDAVPSPNLPVRLGSLLRQHGFTGVHAEAVPILSTAYVADGYSVRMMAQFAQLAHESGAVSEAESQDWLNELERLGAEDAYFFCVNRFLFSAVKE